jgi:hypothetical protein
MSKTTRDTFDTLLIFADAARSVRIPFSFMRVLCNSDALSLVQDPNSVGKFIISMCQYPSDILNMLFMLKLAGMLEGQDGRITRCSFDITGLFETIKDLVNVRTTRQYDHALLTLATQAPSIISDLLAIPEVRNYVCEHRGGKLAVMLGYAPPADATFPPLTLPAATRTVCGTVARWRRTRRSSPRRWR